MARAVVFKKNDGGDIVESWSSLTYPPVPVPGDIVILDGDRHWQVVDRAITHVGDDVYELVCYVEDVEDDA